MVEVLVYLAEHPGETISKEQLIRRFGATHSSLTTYSRGASRSCVKRSMMIRSSRE